jgi:hypothetical protein
VGLCYYLRTQGPPFKGVSAFRAKVNSLVILSKLAAKLSIVVSRPDIFKSLCVEVSGDIMIMWVESTRGDLAVPVDNRIIP